KEDLYYYCITDLSGEMKILLRDSPFCFAKFTPDGGTIFLERGKEGSMIGFGPRGKERFRHPMGTWFSSYSDLHIIGDEVLLNGSGNLFLKCSTENGQITGIYPFPSGYYLTRHIHVFEDRVFLFSRTMPEIPCDIRGTNLLSFEAGSSSPGWLDIYMEPLDPNTGSAYETFDDTDVRVRFVHDYGGAGLDQNLHVTFAEGIATSSDRSAWEFLWTTPSLGSDEERNVPVTATLGPVSRTFPVKVISPGDFLEFSLIKRFETVNSQGTMKYFLDWELRNRSAFEVNDLEWGLDLVNMKCKYPRLPKQIKAGETRTGTLEMDLIFPGMDSIPDWQGYQVEGRGTITLNYSRGQPMVREFDSRLEILPRYSFRLFLYDPDLKKNVKIDHYAGDLKFFDENGDEITSALSVSSKGTTNEISGFAPGLPDKPVRIKVQVAESEQWVDVAYGDNTSPRTDHPWVLSLPRVTLTLPPNKAPIADFRILSPEPEWSPLARFDGSPSHDRDGEITGYEWDFGDGSTAVSGSSQEISHKFSDSGSYEVKLMVTDNKGANSTRTRKIVVGKPITVNHRETGIPAALAEGSATSYEITLSTGNVENAGTDARVFLALIGREKDDGMRRGSGEKELVPFSGDPFERGNNDKFTVDHSWGLLPVEDLDFITIRHDNSNNRPGWYLNGLKIRDTGNNREWYFAVNSWLATDESQGQRTHGRFFPMEDAYPCGIVFDDNQLQIHDRSYGCFAMTKLSDQAFILPDDAEYFYFTELDRNRELRVFLDGMEIHPCQTSSGDGYYDIPFIPVEHWGVQYATSDVTKPTRFLVRNGPSTGNMEERYIWVFPSKWMGYENSARKMMVLSSLFDSLKSLKPNTDATDIFLCGIQGKAFLSEVQVDLAYSGQIIEDYGMASLGIFGSVPDPTLQWYLKYGAEKYASSKIEKIVKQLTSEAFVSVAGEIYDLMTTLLDAAEWGSQLSSVISIAASEAYKVDLLHHLADVSSFKQSAEILKVIKSKMDSLMVKMDANDPAGCEEILTQVGHLVVGDDPTSSVFTDHLIDYGPGVTDYIGNAQVSYPLAFLLAKEIENIAIWKRDGHSFFNNYFGITPGLDKVQATRAAMVIYEPIIRDMFKVAGILVEISLMASPQDPVWNQWGN
nr:PKD domain-containing protein [Synergistales bacterium]